MSKLRLSISMGLASIALSAYAPATPTATLIMQKGYDKGAGLGTGTAQFYDYAPDNRCSGRKRLYKFSPITGKQASKLVPAGTKIVLSAYTNRYNSAIGTASGAPGVTVNSASCENRVEFTPIAGEVYDVVQKVEVAKRCTIRVTLKHNGAMPTDLTEIDPATCTTKKIASAFDGAKVVGAGA